MRTALLLFLLAAFLSVVVGCQTWPDSKPEPKSWPWWEEPASKRSHTDS